jgi:hypothetical protein
MISKGGLRAAFFIVRVFVVSVRPAGSFRQALSGTRFEQDIARFL